MNLFQKIENELKLFAQERDWEKFHSPKNLAMALSVEVSELVEIFQWKTERQSKNLSEIDLLKVTEELADVQMYLLRLTSVLCIDMEAAINEKMVKNSKKYPVDLVRGSAKKYNEY